MRLTTAMAVLLAVTSAALPAQEHSTHQVFENRAAPADFVFFTGNLNWFFQARTGNLSMKGHATTTNGGVVSQVTACFYNESSFTRRFRATASIEQGSSTIQSITFSRDFRSQFFTCHLLTDFNARVAPGNFQVTVSYNLLDNDNVFLGLPATDSGQTFDVQVGSSRPPTATGPQGTIPLRGVGIKYRFAEDDDPPPPPPPPPPSEDPEPPSVSPLTSVHYPGFRFWVRFSDSRIGTSVDGCLPETVCVAGSIPTRAEVFLRIVGPKANGYLWPNVLKFNTTKTEVWIEQISTGLIKYYLLPQLATDSDTLPGVVDKTGFLP
jgi:hypothetical protein